MNNCIQRIVEGFFSGSTQNMQGKPTININLYKEQLKEKLLNAEPIEEGEWDFINDFMDGYVHVNNKVLTALCTQSINMYGNEVPLNWIDTSNIIDMSWLFLSLRDFNGDISRWDVSKVTNMREMFLGCKKFNGDLSRWDVSNVIDMHRMFMGCEIFNQDISRWDVSSVTDMGRMFWGCNKFNSDMSKWDVSRVTNMILMFYNCENFNGDLSRWDVGNVFDMTDMFCDCPIPKSRKPKFKR